MCIQLSGSCLLILTREKDRKERLRHSSLSVSSRTLTSPGFGVLQQHLTFGVHLEPSRSSRSSGSPHGYRVPHSIAISFGSAITPPYSQQLAVFTSGLKDAVRVSLKDAVRVSRFTLSPFQPNPHPGVGHLQLFPHSTTTNFVFQRRLSTSFPDLQRPTKSRQTVFNCRPNSRRPKQHLRCFAVYAIYAIF